MSERDRDQRPQGSSPYDEPTETFRVPQTPPGPDGGDTGVYGYQPYRRGDHDDSSAETARGSIADGEPGHLTASAGERAAGERPYWGDDDAPATTALPAQGASDPARSGTTKSDAAESDSGKSDPAPKTAAIPAVDRDDFHREHNRRAYMDTDTYDDDTDTQVFSPQAGQTRDDFRDDEFDDETRALDSESGGRFSRRRKRADPTLVEEELAEAAKAGRRGTTDLGLLVLRVAVGLIAMAHGSQKLFGWWNGPRLSGFENFLLNSPNPDIGFSGDAAKPLAIVGALSESLGGLMLVLGLLTPIAGSAVLGVMIIAATYKATLAGGVWFFASGQNGPGIEYEVFLGIAAAVIILVGPGKIALDFGRGWSTRPYIGSVAWLVVGIAAPVAIWIVFNGTNPFQSPGNPPVQ